MTLDDYNTRLCRRKHNTGEKTRDTKYFVGKRINCAVIKKKRMYF